jgi:hypothetical protein
MQSELMSPIELRRFRVVCFDILITVSSRAENQHHALLILEGWL